MIVQALIQALRKLRQEDIENILGYTLRLSFKKEKQHWEID